MTVVLLFTRAVEKGRFDVLKLDSELKMACAKVKAVTVAHHSDPHGIFVHCSEPVTEEERSELESVIEHHSSE